VNAGTERSEKPPFITTHSTNYSLGLSASYIVDLFGRNRALAEAADLNAIASRYDRDVVVVATLASVANTWFQLVASQDRLRLAREDIRVAQNVLDAINARVAVGTATALDQAQQESVVATQRASVPPLEQVVQQNRNLLAVLVGRTPERMTVRGGSLNSLKIPQPRVGLPSQLLLRRPDVASAETHLAAEHASVTAARLAFFPTINLSASLTSSSLVLANLFNPNSIAASLVEGLTAPIFTGFNLEGQLEQTRGRRTELLENYRKAILTAFSDVENALIASQQTANHERLQRIAVDAARRAYQITQQRLREGTIDVVTLLNTQTTLFQAEDQLIQVRLQRFLAAGQLYQALGGGFTLEDSPGLTIVADPSVPERIVEETR
jgi:multidrug efflux system outer membrane protein